MAARSAELATGTLAATAAATATSVFTCPEGKTVLVKTILAYCTTGGGTMEPRVDSLGGPAVPVTSLVGTTSSIHRLETWVVLEPGGQLLLVQSDGAGAWRYHISGAILEGVAS